MELGMWWVSRCTSAQKQDRSSCHCAQRGESIPPGHPAAAFSTSAEHDPTFACASLPDKWGLPCALEVWFLSLSYLRLSCISTAFAWADCSCPAPCASFNSVWLKGQVRLPATWKGKMSSKCFSQHSKPVNLNSSSSHNAQWWFIWKKKYWQQVLSVQQLLWATPFLQNLAH